MDGSARVAASATGGGDPLARRRRGVYALTWLAYASAYLGRKPLSVAKATLGDALALSPGTLAAVDTVYLAAYAASQVAMGALGDRVGARRLVGWGLLACGAACALSGAATGSGLLLGAALVAGVAQSTGWPGNNRAMAAWTPPARRGTVMGAWSTCYQVGGVAATALAAWLLSHRLFPSAIAPWRATFFAPAIAMAAVGALVLARLRDRPPPSGSAEVAAAAPSLPLPAAATVEAARSARRLVFSHPLLYCYGAAYFALKLIRYTLLFWLPYYLAKEIGLAASTAGYVSTALEAGGVAGALGLGYLSDTMAGLSRAGWAAASMVLLAVALALLVALHPTHVLPLALALALVGALLFGPDALLSGAAAQEAGGPDAAATATGFVNGIGSVGAVLQGAVTVGVTRAWGWPALFVALLGVALAGALALLPAILSRAPTAAAKGR